MNEKSDVYSFGVVVLELVTGKRATGEREYGDSLDIVRWIRNKLTWEQQHQGVLDRRIIEGENDGTGNCTERMLSMLAVGLRCTSSFPSRRPSMKQVLEMLQCI